MSAHACGCRSLMGVLVEKDVVCHHLLVATSPSVMQHLVLVLNNGGGGMRALTLVVKGWALGVHDMEVVTRQTTTSVIVGWVWGT